MHGTCSRNTSLTPPPFPWRQILAALAQIGAMIIERVAFLYRSVTTKLLLQCVGVWGVRPHHATMHSPACRVRGLLVAQIRDGALDPHHCVHHHPAQHKYGGAVAPPAPVAPPALSRPPPPPRNPRAFHATHDLPHSRVRPDVPFTHNGYAIVYYLIWVVYFFLGAAQVHHGSATAVLPCGGDLKPASPRRGASQVPQGTADRVPHSLRHPTADLLHLHRVHGHSVLAGAEMGALP